MGARYQIVRVVIDDWRAGYKSTTDAAAVLGAHGFPAHESGIYLLVDTADPDSLRVVARATVERNPSAPMEFVPVDPKRADKPKPRRR